MTFQEWEEHVVVPLTAKERTIMEDAFNAGKKTEREDCAVAAEKQARWLGYPINAAAIAAYIRAGRDE